MASVSSSSVDSLSLFNEPLPCFEFVTFVVLQVCCTGAGICRLRILDDASDAVRHGLKPIWFSSIDRGRRKMKPRVCRQLKVIIDKPGKRPGIFLDEMQRALKPFD